MKVFTAKVVDKSGGKKLITEEAISKELFEDSLYSRGYFIIHTNEAATNPIFTPSLKKKFLLDFTYNVYSLLEFGIDINEVFKILKDIYTTGMEKEFINEIDSSLKKGEKLSAAIRSSKSSKIFDEFFITMIASGEISGRLDDSFKLIFTYIKNNNQIKEKLVSAAIYPGILLSILTVVVHFMLIFVMPSIMNIFDGIGVKPSLIINIMFLFAEFLKKNFIFYFIFIIVLAFLAALFFKSKYSKPVTAFLGQYTPIVSRVFLLNLKIRVAFSFKILLKGGASIEDALIKMNEFEKNPVINIQFRKALENLKEGGSLKNSFKHLKMFDSRDLNVIEIADAISKSEEGLDKIYTDAIISLDSYIERLFKIIEPVILVIIGLIVGFSMYLITSPLRSSLGTFQN